ncbi:MAG TPA: hypothetical protein VF720_01815 [Candidatus Eisenbacteria bacterium]
MRDSRPLLITFIVVLAAIGVFYQQKDAARRRAARIETPAPADSFPDADQDGAPDPLPVRRLAGSPEALPALEAVAAAGGQAAWQARPAFAVDIEEVYFDDRGLIREERTSRLVMSRLEPRFVLITSDGRARLGIGDTGPWFAARGDNGLWAPGYPPGVEDDGGLRDVAQRVSWLHRLPFVLGDVEVTLEAPPSGEPPDSLIHLTARRPAAPGDTTGARIDLGFDPATRHLVACRYLDASPLLLVRFDDFRAETPGGLVRPHRWSLFEQDSVAEESRHVLEMRLGDIDWNIAATRADFQPPAS